MWLAGDTLRFARRFGANALIAIIPLLVIFGFIAWRALRDPTPSELCERLDALTHTVASEALRDQCISTYEGLQDLSERLYRELATCLDRATTTEQAAACSGGR